VATSVTEPEPSKPKLRRFATPAHKHDALWLRILIRNTVKGRNNDAFLTQNKRNFCESFRFREMYLLPQNISQTLQGKLSAKTKTFRENEHFL
jgi:hypothetical protein